MKENLNEKSIDEKYTWEKFEKEKRSVLKKCEGGPIEGKLSDKDAINKANFNGVYIICNEKNEVIYIGSAFTNKFKISDRLNIHLNGHESNGTLVNSIMKQEKLDLNNLEERQKIKNIIHDKYSFKAYKFESIEYLLIKDVPGLLNLKGNNK